MSRSAAADVQKLRTQMQESRIAHRALQEAVIEGDTGLAQAFASGVANYWRRRAAQLEAARPRRTDYNGRVTAADAAARWERLTRDAEACRLRAELTDLSSLDYAHTVADLTHGAAL